MKEGVNVAAVLFLPALPVLPPPLHYLFWLPACATVLLLFSRRLYASSSGFVFVYIPAGCRLRFVAPLRCARIRSRRSGVLNGLRFAAVIFALPHACRNHHHTATTLPT